jgi:hypothetical protein
VRWRFVATARNFCWSVAFGFLASKEVRAAGVGNLGLQDRTPIARFALFILSNGPEWIRTPGFSVDSQIHCRIWRRSGESDHVRTFFSPAVPSSLTRCIYSAGESSGAISASMHMLANGGDNEGLFRSAFMRSGAPIPVGSVENGQKCKSSPPSRF